MCNSLCMLSEILTSVFPCGCCLQWQNMDSTLLMWNLMDIKRWEMGTYRGSGWSLRSFRSQQTARPLGNKKGNETKDDTTPVKGLLNYWTCSTISSQNLEATWLPKCPWGHSAESVRGSRNNFSYFSALHIPHSYAYQAMLWISMASLTASFIKGHSARKSM